MRETKTISVWPVGLVADTYYHSPVCSGSFVNITFFLCCL